MINVLEIDVYINNIIVGMINDKWRFWGRYINSNFVILNILSIIKIGIEEEEERIGILF